MKYSKARTAIENMIINASSRTKYAASKRENVWGGGGGYQVKLMYKGLQQARQSPPHPTPPHAFSHAQCPFATLKSPFSNLEMLIHI